MAYDIPGIVYQDQKREKAKQARLSDLLITVCGVDVVSGKMHWCSRRQLKAMISGKDPSGLLTTTKLEAAVRN